MSPALTIALKAVGNIILVWGLNTYLPAYFTVFGGLAAYVIIGSLLTILNMFLRPLLSIVTFPLHLFFSLFTSVFVNAAFLGIVYYIALQLDPNIVVLTITGGVAGWIIVSMVLGIANWLMKFF